MEVVLAKDLKQGAQSKKAKDTETKAKRKSDAKGFAEAASAFEEVARKPAALDEDQTRAPQSAQTIKKDPEAKAKRKSDATGSAEAAGGFKEVARESVAIDDDQIRVRAYSIWIEEGQPHGRDLEHWQRARDEFKGA